MIYLNNTLIVPTMFSDGTSQVWKLSESLTKFDKSEINWEFTHEGEFIHLAQLKQLLSVCSDPSKIINLTLKYLPYARQDKQISNTTTFALKTFATLLNSLKFNSVSILDPHSIQALYDINNSYAYYPDDEIVSVANNIKTDVVCYPDNGAVSKYTKVYEFPYIFGEKVRDQLTGNITDYKLIGHPKNKNVLIVDDICDGGMTFILLAKELYAADAKDVNLFVTHGIFSKGLKVLKEAGIKRIFTADGEAFEDHNGLSYRRL